MSFSDKVETGRLGCEGEKEGRREEGRKGGMMGRRTHRLKRVGTA